MRELRLDNADNLLCAVLHHSGSGSSYIYGFCDSTWRPGMSREQTLEFVKHALSLAMSRDGSSGGTIRMADISEKGVERHFVPGDQLPVLSAKIV